MKQKKDIQNCEGQLYKPICPSFPVLSEAVLLPVLVPHDNKLGIGLKKFTWQELISVKNIKI